MPSSTYNNWGPRLCATAAARRPWRLLLLFLMIRRPPRSALFPCATLFRSRGNFSNRAHRQSADGEEAGDGENCAGVPAVGAGGNRYNVQRNAAAFGGRKSTRLNSSHDQASHAVFYL